MRVGEGKVGRRHGGRRTGDPPDAVNRHKEPTAQPDSDSSQLVSLGVFLNLSVPSFAGHTGQLYPPAG